MCILERCRIRPTKRSHTSPELRRSSCPTYRSNAICCASNSRKCGCTLAESGRCTDPVTRCNEVQMPRCCPRLRRHLRSQGSKRLVRQGWRRKEQVCRRPNEHCDSAFSCPANRPLSVAVAQKSNQAIQSDGPARSISRQLRRCSAIQLGRACPIARKATPTLFGTASQIRTSQGVRNFEAESYGGGGHGPRASSKMIVGSSCRRESPCVAARARPRLASRQPAW